MKYLLIQENIDLENQDTILGLSFLAFFIIAGIMYFLPSIIALFRGKSNTIAIIALNFFLGWSLVGWVVSLVWSLSSDNKPQKIIVNQNSLPTKTNNKDPYQKLEKLKELLDNGAITQKEYNSQKKKLLRN